MKNVSFALLASLLLSVFVVTPVWGASSLETSLTTKESVLGESSVVPPSDISPTPEPLKYNLPYPGILPDHPLYFLKQIRDQILDRLIVDPLRKGEFNILQADKRLVMGQMLLEKGKGALGEEVISKGEKYLEKAEDGLVAAKNQGKTVPPYLVDRLSNAASKHIEVLEGLIAKATGPEKSGLTASLELAKKVKDNITKLQ